ncbi:MAG: ribosome biogenesis GTP-binding protein YihA/YsxC [Clostridia bacterium]
MNLHNAEFIRSAVKIADFPNDELPQVVFAGKSNVGKSSVINRILNRKNFARVGAAPGKTTHINYFLIDKSAYFVDLPGYGYAKVSKEERARWGRLIEEFFDTEKPVHFGVFIVDIRHKPTAADEVMGECFKQMGVPFCVVANKSDKLKKGQIEPALQLIAESLDVSREIVVPFSSEKGDGRDEVINRILKQVDIGGEI